MGHDSKPVYGNIAVEATANQFSALIEIIVFIGKIKLVPDQVYLNALDKIGYD